MRSISYRLFQSFGRRFAEFFFDDTGEVLSTLDLMTHRVVVPGYSPKHNPRNGQKAAFFFNLPRNEALAILEKTGFTHSEDRDDDPEPRLVSHEPGGLSVWEVPMETPDAQRRTLTLAEETIGFNLGMRIDGEGNVCPEAVLCRRDQNGDWEDVVDFDISDLPDCLSQNRGRFTFKSGLITTVEALESLGGTFTSEIFLWHKPEELTFGVLDAEPGENTTVIVMPKQDSSPVFDDLRDDHLSITPPCFDGNEAENLWAVKPDCSRTMILNEMKSLGFTHDPDLERI